MPLVQCCVAFVIPYAKRGLDNGFTNDPYKTKKTSIQNFKALYTGVEYLIHFKYSDGLNVSYIAMMYGLGMPLLYPVAALTLSSQWLSERIQIAYTVRQPPAMDNSLSNNALSKIRWAPLFLLFNGFWMVDNRQMFNGDWNYIMRETDYMKSGHAIHSLEVTQSAPLFLMVFMSVIIITLQIIIPDSLLSSWGFSL